MLWVDLLRSNLIQYFILARRLPALQSSKPKIYESLASWWLLFALSIIMAIFFLRMAPESLRIREIIHNEKYVTVDIVEVRTSSFGRRPVHSLTFQYQDYKGHVNIGYKFFDQVKDKKVARMLHSDNYPELFIPPIMPPDYNDESQFYSFIAVTCFCILTASFSAYKIYSISGKRT